MLGTLEKDYELLKVRYALERDEVNRQRLTIEQQSKLINSLVIEGNKKQREINLLQWRLTGGLDGPEFDQVLMDAEEERKEKSIGQKHSAGEEDLRQD